MMDELIRREDAIKAVVDGLSIKPSETVVRKIIEAVPAASPVKHGKWIESEIQDPRDLENNNRLYICSNCGYSDLHAVAQEVPYCWWCGAKMDGEKE